jgi:hypothetical protein
MLAGCRTVWKDVLPLLSFAGVPVLPPGELVLRPRPPSPRLPATTLGGEPASPSPASAQLSSPAYSGNISGASDLPDVVAQFKKRVLTYPEQRAAALVAEGARPSDVARMTGIHRAKLESLRKDGDWMDMLEALSSDFRAGQMSSGIARREVRVMHLQNRHDLVSQIVAQRAQQADPDSAYYVPGAENVPGASTGLLARTLRSMGSGPYQQVVEDWGLDSNLLAQLSAIEEKAAVELGHRVAKSEVTVTGKAYIGVNLELV